MPPRLLWRYVCAFVLTASSLQAAAPTLTSLYPAGGQRGQKVTVTCTGAFSWPVNVFAPGVDVAVLPDSGKLDITIPADLPADRIWIRLHSAEGASELRPFLIGSRPEVVETEPNNARREAQAIPSGGVVMNGILQAGGDVDGFAVDLLAGETLVAALDANTRLGSPMDAMMQIVTPQGTVLAENNDQIGLDPRIAYTARTGGKHIVRVFAFPSDPNSTISYSGAASYIYRLTLTTGSFVSHAAPMTLPIQDPGTVEIFGWNIPPNTILPVQPYGGPRLADFPEFEIQSELRTLSSDRIGFAFTPDFPSPMRVRLTSSPILRGIVTPDPANPPMLTLPTSLTGCLRLPHQTDTYLIPLKKGERILVPIETRSIDSLLDAPIIRLYDPAGGLAQDVNVPSPAQVYHVSHAAAAEGNYRLTIHDRLGLGGERMFYRLSARLDEPDFELTAAADQIVIPHDKPAELVVNVVRRTNPGGSVGPITIEAVDLPAGVSVPAVTSEPTGATSEKVTLAFTSTGVPFSGRFRIVGKTTLSVETERFARTPAQFGATFESFWVTVLAKPQ